MLTAGELRPKFNLAIESGVFEVTARPPSFLTTCVTRKLLVREDANPESNEEDCLELLILFSDADGFKAFFWLSLKMFDLVAVCFVGENEDLLGKESFLKDEGLRRTLFVVEIDFLMGVGTGRWLFAFCFV